MSGGEYREQLIDELLVRQCGRIYEMGKNVLVCVWSSSSDFALFLINKT